MTNEEIMRLKVRLTELERLVRILIERYNEHWHDADDLTDYGHVTFEPKKKFQVK